MNKTRAKGKTAEEAIENGLKILGIDRDKAEIVIIGEGKAAVLGVFGGEEAEVEVRAKTSKSEDAKEVLQNILNGLGLMAIAEVASEENDTISLEVKGEDLGKAIGKEGSMLKAMQLLVSNIVSRSFSERVRVRVDAGGYIDKQEQALVQLAKEAAQDVAESGQEKVLPPMSASDRRLIHMALGEMDKIQTYSKGEGKDRRLVIAPK